MLELVVSIVMDAAIPAHELAHAIVQEAAIAAVDPVLVAKIVMVESRGRPDAVSDTNDIGLMQINAIHGIEERCLLDWRCNLKAGVAILAQFRNHRPCAYNVGYRYKTRLTKCLQYEARLDKVFSGGSND